MMRTKLFLVAVFAVAVAAGVSAQAFSVSFLDGTVDLKTAKGWQAVVIGDKVPADASIRLSQNASLELQRGKTRITLMKDGTYEMASVAKASEKAVVGGTGTVIAQKLQSLKGEKALIATTAGGVRAGDKSDQQVTWSDGSEEALSDANTLIEQKDFAQAVSSLDEDIKEFGDHPKKGEFIYLKAVALYRSGQLAQAYRSLAAISPKSSDSMYARFVILKAQILIDTENFANALAVLAPFLKDYPKGEAAQVAYLLSAYCDKGIGDMKAARQSLNAGYEIDPNSDTGRLIDEQRKSL